MAPSLITLVKKTTNKTTSNLGQNLFMNLNSSLILKSMLNLIDYIRV